MPSTGEETASPISEPQVQQAKAGASLGLEAVVLGWCVWLLGSWLVAIGPQWLSLVPGIRYMGVAAVIGSMLLWPAFRLSQDLPTGRRRFGLPGALSLLWITCDWLGMNLVWLGVALTLSLMRQWEPKQVGMLSAALACWTMLAGMLIVWGLDGPVRRLLAMGGCVAMVLGAPLLRAATGAEVRGPLATLWSLAKSQGAVPGWNWTATLVWLAIAAGAAFVFTLAAVAVSTAGEYRGPSGGASGTPDVTGETSQGL